MARRFSRLGARVVLWDINEANLSRVATSIRQQRAGHVYTYKVNVTDHESVYRTAQRVSEEVGVVDILINNAGIVSGKFITELDEAKVEQIFRVNVFAHFYTIKAFLPAMISRNSGHVVTISSASGIGGAVKLTDYSASKFAVFGLDESLRMELEHRGVTGVKTTCVCPYYIRTGMFDGVQSGPLVPILDEDYAAQSIVDAIRSENPVLIMPRLLYLVPFLRFLLPVGLFDWVAKFLGITKSMDEFKGRQ